MPAEKILVVDDSQAIQIFVKRILTGAGYEVITAGSGNQALDCLDDQQPDLMILDIVMPGLDGYGVAAELESRGFGQHRLPVIFLTTERSHALQLLGNQFGAYLPKPVDREALLAAVEHQLASKCHAQA